MSKSTDNSKSSFEQFLSFSIGDKPIDFDEDAYWEGYQRGWIRGFTIGAICLIICMIAGFFIDIQINFS